MRNGSIIGISALIILASCRPLLSQSTRPADSRSAPPPGKPTSEAVDERMLFLTVQLASVETSIDAMNRALRATAGARDAKEAEAARHRKGNELMDRNMGMQTNIRWEKFYGTTAEKFFYHPVDRSTSYHTETVLTQRPVREDAAPADAAPSRQGVPVHDRPPQIDYIYRANEESRHAADAEAAKLAGKSDSLLARRRQLETEQSALWCKVAFRGIVSRDILAKPLYRFELKGELLGAGTNERLVAARAVADFLRVANALTVEAEKQVDRDQSRYFTHLQDLSADARQRLDSVLNVEPTLAPELSRPGSTIARFAAVAKRLCDVGKNIADAHKLALDGDVAGDGQRKNTFRGLLQDSVITYAEAVLAGDECLAALVDEWKLAPDRTSPIDLVALVASPGLPASTEPGRPRLPRRHRPATRTGARTRHRPQRPRARQRVPTPPTGAGRIAPVPMPARPLDGPIDWGRSTWSGTR